MPRLDQAHAVFVGDVAVDIGISLGRTEVWAPQELTPQNTVLPSISGGATVGSTLTGSYGTWVNADTYAIRWQVDDAGNWVDVGDMDTTLADAQAGQYRIGVIASNEFGASAEVFSLPFVVSAGSGLPVSAVQFVGDEAGATSASPVASGGTAFTIVGLVFLPAGSRKDYCTIFANRFTGDRKVTLATNNAFGSWPVSISNNQGNTIPFGTDMGQGVWYVVSLAGDGNLNNAGTFRATYQPLDGSGPLVSVTVQKGEFFTNAASIGVQMAGGGDYTGWPAGARYNWVRAYSSYLSTTDLEAQRLNSDPAGALYWWEFSNNGSGGVAVADLTGNSIVPTVTAGTLADGPGA